MLADLAAFLPRVTKFRYEENFSDRLNYQYTGWILLAFTLTLSTKEYMGKPVQCWVPAQFTGGWEQYVEDYCFVENTYYLPFERTIAGTNIEERDKRMLNYYQWIPFVLALMFLMFNLPHVIWRSINWLSGLHVRALVCMAKDAMEDGSEEEIESTAKMISTHMHDSIEIETAVSRSGNPLGWFFSCGMTHGCYVVITYLFMKVLFIINIIGQFFILQSFLGTKYKYWGANILHDIAQEHDWRDSGHFPRVTLCDFRVRVLGNVQRFSVQCVLMINMFAEKIFLFIWWWFVFVAVVTILDFIYWLFVAIFSGPRESFIKQMLNAHGLPRRENEWKIQDFVKRMLRPDGVFALHLIASNAGELIASRVVQTMWIQYIEKAEGGDAYTPPPKYAPSSPKEIDDTDSHFRGTKPTPL